MTPTPTTTPTTTTLSPAVTVTPGQLGAAEFDFPWSELAQATLRGAVGMVPVAGGLISGLIPVFWPKKDTPDVDVWGQIRQQAERLVNQKISDLVYQQTSDALSGLKNNMADYLSALGTGDTTVISSHWIATQEFFENYLPRFQTKEYQVPLLPLFAGFGNLHLSLLRDGVLFGQKWGWNAAYQSEIRTKLTLKIAGYTQYARGIVDEHVRDMDNHGALLMDQYAYRLEMTLQVLDFADLWEYLDPTTYPIPITVRSTREIYAGPVGGGDSVDFSPITLGPPPNGLLQKFTVWAGNSIDSIEVTYFPDGTGPGGVTTKRMGGTGGSNTAPHGGTVVCFPRPANPVISVEGTHVPHVQSLIFQQANGVSTPQFGGLVKGLAEFSYGPYPGHILSRIYIHGINSHDGAADFAIFGFQRAAIEQASVDVQTLQRFYVTAPTDVTLEALAAACLKAPAPLAELQAKAAAEGWDAQRAEFRSHLAALAKR